MQTNGLILDHWNAFVQDDIKRVDRKWQKKAASTNSALQTEKRKYFETFPSAIGTKDKNDSETFSAAIETNYQTGIQTVPEIHHRQR